MWPYCWTKLLYQVSVHTSNVVGRIHVVLRLCQHPVYLDFLILTSWRVWNGSLVKLRVMCPPYSGGQTLCSLLTLCEVPVSNLCPFVFCLPCFFTGFGKLYHRQLPSACPWALILGFGIICCSCFTLNLKVTASPASCVVSHPAHTSEPGDRVEVFLVCRRHFLTALRSLWLCRWCRQSVHTPVPFLGTVIPSHLLPFPGGSISFLKWF